MSVPHKVALLYAAAFMVILASGIIAPQEVVIAVDGEEELHHTYSTLVFEILEEAGIELREEDRVEPNLYERLNRNEPIVIDKAYPLYVEVDGQMELVFSPGETVQELLTRLDVELGMFDQVEPGWRSVVSAFDLVSVKRVVLTEEREEEEVPAGLEVLSDSTLPSGTSRVKQEGFPGVRERVYQVTLVDGKEEGRELLEINVIKEAQDRIVLKGTKIVTSVVTSSRGNIRIGDVWEGIASWYGGDGDGFHGRTTANGETFDSGALTAAHRYFPFGTVVRVTHLSSSREVQVRINDRGPFTGGRIIDLSRAAAEVIGMRSSGTARVRLEIITLP